MRKWTELRTAYHVAQLGTVSAAAKELGYNRATVNRHIDALEADLGARVFIRHGQGYALTEVGEDVLQVAEKTSELLGSLAGRIQGRKSSIEGEIRLTTLAPFVHYLTDAITQFKSQNPRCNTQIDVSEDLARLEFGEAHIALRAGKKPSNPDYVVQEFCVVELGLYAHQSYVDRFGLPNDTNDLEGHRFVLPNLENQRFPFMPWVKRHVKTEMFVATTSNTSVISDALSMGVGLGFMSHKSAAVRGGFHLVFEPKKSWSIPLWLVTHVDLHRTEKIQAMLSCIRSTKE